MGAQRRELVVTALIGLLAAASGGLSLFYFVGSARAYGALAIPFGGILFIPSGLIFYALAAVFFRRLRRLKNRGK
jgi:biotin transporter BioY